MNEMNDHSNPSTPLIDKNVTCNSECGLDLKLGQGCDGHKCKYISEIQPQVMSKSVIKRLSAQKPETEDYSKHECVKCGNEGSCDEVCPEQTEADKIREAFETGANEIYCLDKWAWGNYKHQVIEIYLEHYSNGYKSRQQEIEELHTAIKEEMSHVNRLVQDNLKKQQEIEEMKKDLSHYWVRIKKVGEHIEHLEQQNKLLQEVVDGAILMNEKIKKVLIDTEQDG